MSNLTKAVAALALELPAAVHRDFSALLEHEVRTLQSKAWHEGYDASTEDGDRRVAEGQEARNPYWRPGDDRCTPPADDTKPAAPPARPA